ncbi:hypothetical protein IKE87_02230 [Candidatus Saccharibacteria bacterium]|nr:hypothetical protein [Candidatus Saccharibacteria bacterium]
MDPTQNPSATPNIAPGATPNMTPGATGTNPMASAALGVTAPMSETPTPSPSEVAGAATSPDAGAFATTAADPLAGAAVSPLSSTGLSMSAPASAEPLSTQASNPVPSPMGETATTETMIQDTTTTSTLGESGTPGVAAPVNPIIQPGGATTGLNNMDGLLSTDPIMKPEPAPAPDPVEEELKTPMKAAGLAPGSIGSASGVVNSEGKAENPPAASTPLPNNPFSSLFKKKQNPSVAFNDPAKANEENDASKPELSVPGAKPKKPNLKINKQTMIILIALAAILVVVLVVILVMQLNTPSSSSNNSSSNANNSSSANTPTVEPVAVTPEVVTSLSCARKMTVEELADFTNSLDGTVIVGATFDGDDNLIELSRTQLVEYTDTKTDKPMLVTESLIRTTPDGIDATNVDRYMLQVASDGGVDTDLKSLTSNYQNLDFTCETL